MHCEQSPFMTLYCLATPQSDAMCCTLMLQALMFVVCAFCQELSVRYPPIAMVLAILDPLQLHHEQTVCGSCEGPKVEAHQRSAWLFAQCYVEIAMHSVRR